jgi:hypothetical protein
MKKQRGVSLSGLLLVSFVLMLVALLGFKLLPPYLEYLTIKKTLKEISINPESKSGNKKDVQVAFVRRSSIDNITSIGPNDIDIAKDGDKVVLSASWAVKVPLVKNISAYMEFEASSDQ